MNNRERYIKTFVEAFELEVSEVEKLEYNKVAEWDSIGHMNLMAEVEDEFDIMFETEDIIDFSSFEKGIEILKKYDIDC